MTDSNLIPVARIERIAGEPIRKEPVINFPRGYAFVTKILFVLENGKEVPVDMGTEQKYSLKYYLDEMPIVAPKGVYLTEDGFPIRCSNKDGKEMREVYNG